MVMIDRGIWIEEACGEKILFGVALVAGVPNANGLIYKSEDLNEIARDAACSALIYPIETANSGLDMLGKTALQVNDAFVEDDKIIVSAHLFKDTKYLPVAELVKTLVEEKKVGDWAFTISCFGKVENNIIQKPKFAYIHICKKELLL